MQLWNKYIFLLQDIGADQGSAIDLDLGPNIDLYAASNYKKKKEVYYL